MAARPRFDPNRPFVAALDLTWKGRLIPRGGRFPKAECRRGQLKIMYESRRLNMLKVDVAMGPLEPGGYYTIHAPWLEPERIHGKVRAQRRRAQLEAEGPPEDWQG